MMRSWVIVLLLVPAAGASSPVDVYMHAVGWQDMPANTQQPEGEWVGRTGAWGHSGCVPLPSFTLADNSRHTWYAYGSRGAVEYDVDDGGRPRFHTADGLAADLRIDPHVTPVLTWHLAATGPSPELDQAVQVIPDVVVRVHVRASDGISVGHTAFDEGPLVAAGEVGPVTLHAGVGHEAVTVHQAGGLTVYAIQVPLRLHNHTIAKEDGYNIRIDAMMDNPHCAESRRGGYVMPDMVSPYQGHGLWNRLHLGVLDPLHIEYMHAQALGHAIVIHATAVSPFGGHDIRGEDMLAIDGPMQLPVQHRLVRGTNEHARHYGLFESTWIIDVSQAVPGVYTVEVLVRNLQGTANATAHATFEIGQAGVRVCQQVGPGWQCTMEVHDAQAPALPLAWALVALILLRRRD